MGGVPDRKHSGTSRQHHSIAKGVPCSPTVSGSRCARGSCNFIQPRRFESGTLGYTRRVDGDPTHIGLWVLYEVANKNLGLAVLGVVMLLGATNTGYYIRFVGAELFSMLLVVSMVWLSWSPARLRNVELAGLAALAGFLITVRPQSFLMASPALALGVIRWALDRPTRQLAWAIAAVGPVLGLGLFIVLQVNYWMTGEWTRPAYYFGNDQFQSLSLAAPYLKLVLFDSSAGILRCTPFIALGFCASLFHIFDRKLERPYRAFYLVFFFAGLAQIWIDAGYYGWAGGEWRFGSRYLNLLSLYAVIPVIHFWASERVGWRIKAGVLSVALVCAAYTTSLLGVRSFVIPLAGGAAVAVWMYPRRQKRAILYGCLGLSILFPLLYNYVKLAEVRLLDHSIPAIELGCFAAIVGGTALYLIWQFFLSPLRVAVGVALFTSLILVIEFSLVARLRIGAAAFQAQQLASPSPQFLYKNNFDLRNLEDDLTGQTVYK